MKTSLFQVLVSPLADLQNQSHAKLNELKTDIISAFNPFKTLLDIILGFSGIYLFFSINNSLDTLFGHSNLDAISSVMETTMLLSLISVFFIQYRLAVFHRVITSLLADKTQQSSELVPA